MMIGSLSGSLRGEAEIHSEGGAKSLSPEKEPMPTSISNANLAAESSFLPEKISEILQYVYQRFEYACM